MRHCSRHHKNENSDNYLYQFLQIMAIKSVNLPVIISYSVSPSSPLCAKLDEKQKPAFKSRLPPDGTPLFAKIFTALIVELFPNIILLSVM